MTRWGIALSVVLASPGVLAQEPIAECPDRPADPGAARQQAGRWFAQGQQLAERAQFEDALGAFACSLRMLDHPNTLFNAGKAARLAGQRKIALELWRRYLLEAPEGEWATTVRGWVAEIEEEQAALPAEPPTDTAPEDPQAPAPPPPTEAPPPKPAPPAATPKSPASPPIATTEPADTNWATAGYVALALGGAALVAGTVLQIAAGVTQSSAEQETSYAAFDDDRTAMETYQRFAVAGFVVGGAAAATGLVFLLLDGSDEPDGVSLAGHPGGLSLKGRF